MALLHGSARQTQAAIIADLTAKVEALSQQIASQPKAKAGKAEMPAFRTKAQRAAGKGWPCTASEPCARRDLRTEGRAKSHGEDGHTARS